MPNWVTNKVKAPSHVIAAMMNEKGNIDFEKILPSPTTHGNDWSGYRSDASQIAEIVCRVPVINHPVIAQMELSNRSQSDVRKLDDEGFEQFIGMVSNYRSCGYLHRMDFSSKVWGTKWNACESSANVEAGTAEFETAWSCPTPVYQAISKQFPDDEISITFADEDIGSNCGTFKLKGGDIVGSNIAPSWSKMTDDEKSKWTAFAYEVTGRNPDPDEE